LQYKKTISKVTTFFGNISYSLYLLHQVLGYFLITILLDSSIYLPFAQMITILVITFAAVIINKYVEIPTNKLGHRCVK
jgi:peptidoglycan/LPS O-acetylase OafA/YrhL